MKSGESRCQSFDSVSSNRCSSLCVLFQEPWASFVTSSKYKLAIPKSRVRMHCSTSIIMEHSLRQILLCLNIQ